MVKSQTIWRKDCIFVVMKCENEKERFCRSVAERVRRAMRDAGIDIARGPVIVALSGGADSVALLAVLHALGCDCRAAHCNFHLRGEESMRDMRHVQSLCESLGIDLYIRDFDVPAQMEASGESVEMACRTLRYRWFDELLDRERASYIAVGHHREDRAETFMLNLMRGAGLDGLTSMRMVEGNIIRPLLDLSRSEIERYLAECGLGFVTDSTNAENEFRRNSLRNRVFPLLSEIFGAGALDSVVKTVENLERSRSIYLETVKTKSERYYDGVSIIDLEALSSLEKEPALVLFEILRDKGFNFSQTSKMVERAKASGLEFSSTDGRTVAEISHGKILLMDAAHRSISDENHIVDISQTIHRPITIRISEKPVVMFTPPTDTAACHAFFDADIALADHLWELRHYRRGDRMIPFGAKRSKLISDIFANAKYSAAEKRRAWFLTCDGEIVWAPGLKNSTFAAIGPETRRFIHLEYIIHT